MVNEARVVSAHTHRHPQLHRPALAAHFHVQEPCFHGDVGHTRPACSCTSRPLALDDASPASRLKSCQFSLFRLIEFPMALPMREIVERLLDGGSPSNSVVAVPTEDPADRPSTLCLSSLVMAYSIACMLSPCARKYSIQSTRFFESVTSTFSCSVAARAWAPSQSYARTALQNSALRCTSVVEAGALDVSEPRFAAEPRFAPLCQPRRDQKPPLGIKDIRPADIRLDMR